MLGIDGEVLSCFGLDQPSELHDRAAGRVEDHAFDALDTSLDAVALSRDHRYVSRGTYGRRGPSLVLTFSSLADQAKVLRTAGEALGGGRLRAIWTSATVGGISAATVRVRVVAPLRFSSLTQRIPI